MLFLDQADLHVYSLALLIAYSLIFVQIVERQSCEVYIIVGKRKKLYCRFPNFMQFNQSPNHELYKCVNSSQAMALQWCPDVFLDSEAAFQARNPEKGRSKTWGNVNAGRLEPLPRKTHN